MPFAFTSSMIDRYSSPVRPPGFQSFPALNNSTTRSTGTKANRLWLFTTMDANGLAASATALALAFSLLLDFWVSVFGKSVSPSGTGEKTGPERDSIYGSLDQDGRSV